MKNQTGATKNTKTPDNDSTLSFVALLVMAFFAGFILWSIAGAMGALN